MPTDHLDLSDLSESQQSEMRILALSMSSSTLPITTQQRVITERLDSYRTSNTQPVRRSRSRTAERQAARTDTDAGQTSNLAERADQVRLEDNRARHLYFYERDVREGKARKPDVDDPRRGPQQMPEPVPVETAPPAPSRYALDCIDCEQTIALHRPTARVPICDRCKAERATKGRPRTEASA